MRLWSLHPQLLDRAALIACWREALLAQKVLTGTTIGYRNHPQLQRFRACSLAPLEAIGAYLTGLAQEASARGYRFDASKILRPLDPAGQLPVTQGQVLYELAHLRAKVLVRSPADGARLEPYDAKVPPPVHSLFTTRPGDVEAWERV